MSLSRKRNKMEKFEIQVPQVFGYLHPSKASSKYWVITVDKKITCLLALGQGFQWLRIALVDCFGELLLPFPSGLLCENNILFLTWLKIFSEETITQIWDGLTEQGQTPSWQV